MRFKEIMKKTAGIVVAAALMLSTVGVMPVMAAEAVEGEAAPAEGEAAPAEGDPAAADAAAVDPAAAAGGTVTPGTIVANNGMYIANDFPAEYMPSGFSKISVSYQGQTIALASMDNSNGEVALAYLTDASGAMGDFYLCDTATATMSDYVRFDGGDGRFIIVLDPGNTAVPEGFTETALSVNGKSVRSWTYTADADSSESGSIEDKDGFLEVMAFAEPIKVHALDLGVGAGASGGDDSAAPADTTGTDVTADPATTDQSTTDGSEGGDTSDADTTQTADLSALDGSVGNPSEYFLIYGINQDGNKGFFLYDSVGQSYTRYVQLGAGSSKELEAAKKSARIRLFIIAGLVVLVLVLAIILINMALSGRKGDTYDDYDDDYEQIKKRVEKKSKSNIKSSKLRRRDSYDDYDDYGYDDEEDDYDDYDEPEDVKVYDRSSKKNDGFTAQVSNDVDWSDLGNMSAPDPGPAKPPKAPSQDIDLDDDFSFDFIGRK